MPKLFLIFFLLIISFFSFSQDVFDIGVRQIEIFFNEPNWDDSLDIYYANNNGERLIADSILIDGLLDENVGVKYKGNSSYNVNNVKNPMNIKLDYINNGQSIDGYNVLKLSNGFRDPSFIREVLSYEIARQYMPASKATYANVFVDGILIGLYTCVQSIDDDFTNEHFYERNGPFFKVDNTGISVPGCVGQLGILEYYSDTNCYQRAYEMQSSNDWEKLGNFLDTLNSHFNDIESVMDIDRALWMMAFENLTVCLDGPINSIPHNFYLFQNNNGRFSTILWDMNMAFGTFTNGLPTPVTINDLQEIDIFHNSNDPNNKLTNQLFSSDRYKRMYVAHMRTILNEQFVNNNYITRANQLQQLIDTDVSADPNPFYTYAEFTSNITTSVGVNPVIGISELMSSRIQYLQSLTEFTVTPPVISNISSSPTNVLPNTSVNITAQISNSNYAYLGYRYKFADEFEKLQMFDDGQHGDGTAGDGVFGATINVDARDVQYYFYAENNDAGIFSPERAEKEFHQLAVVGGLVINEIMAANSSSVADQDGEFDDWVELYNGGVNSINLSGFYLSDNENDLTKWSFPSVSIQPNDYLIIWCDTAGVSQAGLHTTYRLSADQEEVYLSDPSGNVIDAVHYVNMIADKGYARVPNGSGTMQHQDHTYEDNNQQATENSDISYESKFRVYPNPSNTRIYLLGDTRTINVFNMMGQKVYSDNEVKSIDISNWEDGIYFVKSADSVVKIIKQ
ncbi:MAG: CotH kinase family protein [Bacteroidota bacterium]|nr:CotH kinase family protein [Bacteroidota bacterium]